MNKLALFIVSAYADGALHAGQTPEELQEKLLARPGVDDDVTYFLRHAAKTAFANLTVYEVLAGQIKAVNLIHRGEDYLQDRLIAESLDERVALVIREAKWWDYQREKSEQHTCYTA